MKKKSEEIVVEKPEAVPKMPQKNAAKDWKKSRKNAPVTVKNA